MLPYGVVCWHTLMGIPPVPVGDIASAGESHPKILRSTFAVQHPKLDTVCRPL